MAIKPISMAAGAWLLCQGPAAAFGCMDVAIVLAIDSSGSIDDAEYALQTLGIAEAFRDEAVQSAISRAGLVAVSAVFWGDTGYGIQQIDWNVISAPDDAVRFAEEMGRHRRTVSGSTEIGMGLLASLAMFDKGFGCSVRRLINLSGDGRETLMPRRRFSTSVAEVREYARTAGVTINALAISHDEPDLASYYRDTVIVGQGSFVMEARDFAGFAEAIKLKLIKEIEPMKLAASTLATGVDINHLTD